MTLRANLIAAFPEARRISNFLERDLADRGVAVSLDERSDGLWSVDAYFDAGAPGEISASIRDRLGSDAFGAPISVEQLPESDWVRLGLADLKPVAAGRFLVHGRHDRQILPSGRIAIEIDAAQAFGTGHHATTAGCLSVLDRLLRRRRFRNALDLGAGTGVLAIALAKAGVTKVLATDIDPVAAATARENCRINAVAPRVTILAADGVSHQTIRARAPFDLVVANILAKPLVELAPKLRPLVAQDGFLVLSGLLLTQRRQVIAAYLGQGMRLFAAHPFSEWCVLVLERR
jgi:ribosomal protein L11 methyltransferase